MRKDTSILIFILLFTAQAQAQRLPQNAIPQNYKIRLEPSLESGNLRGDEIISINLKAPGNSIFLNSVDLVLSNVEYESGHRSIKGMAIELKDREMMELRFAEKLSAGAGLLKFSFEGKIRKDLRGFYQIESNHKKYAVTQFEGTYARMMFPCFDEPEYKATFDLSVTLPNGYTAISNSKIIADVESDKGTHAIQFGRSPKMSTYLVALAIGDFQCLSSEVDQIPIRVCAVPEKKDLANFALKSAEFFLHFYNNWYGIRYPFGKLDLTAIPDYEWGGMENTASIFFRESSLLIDAKNVSIERKRQTASVVAHEIAHQWFGDLVTMRWWDDIWLNEGFATWMSFKALQLWDPAWDQNVERTLAASGILNLDALGSTRAIRAKAQTPDEIKEMFDGITYQKGAAVLNMLENYTGPEVFRAAVNQYISQHQNGSATAEDFWQTLTQISGKPIDRIMPTFIDQPGAPIIFSTQSCTNGKGSLHVGQQRFFIDTSRSSEESKELWQVPICARSLNAKLQNCRVLTQREQVFELENCEPHILNAGAHGFYRSAYSEKLSETISESATSLNSAELISHLNDSWALVRTGNLDIGKYMILVGNLKDSKDLAIAGVIISKLEQIDKVLVQKQDRAAFHSWLRNWAQPLVKTVSLQPKADDSDDRKEIRAELMELLEIADMTEINDLARNQVLAYQNGENTVDPTLIQTALRILAKHGDRKLFDSYMDALTKAKSPNEYSIYLFALTQFEDPELAKMAITYSESSQMRSQDIPGFFAELLSGPNRDLTWAYLKQRWIEMQNKIVTFGGNGAISALGSSCDPKMLADVETFFSQNNAPAAQRSVERSLESIKVCIQFVKFQQPSFKRWLESTNHPAQ